MIKKFIILSLISTISICSFAQFGYKNKLESVNGIEISYKIVHEKYFDKESPVQLRLKLKNTNNFNVNVNFEIQYQLDFTKKLNSGEVIIEIPRKSAKTGKMHELVFEINSNDPNIFKSEDAEWEFINFDVEEIE